MKIKRYVLSCLAILSIGLIYFAAQAQQKNSIHRARFSGEWKSKESISMGGNIVCCYDEGDRMLSKTMKIAEHPDFLTIEVPKPSPGAALTTNREKLTFDGKETQINYGRELGKKSTVELSADKQTMTVHSIVRFVVATPANSAIQKYTSLYVTEVWKLSDDGKSLSVQASAKSGLFDDERAWTTVFNRIR